MIGRGVREPDLTEPSSINHQSTVLKND